jgi:hypothetical protein
MKAWVEIASITLVYVYIYMLTHQMPVALGLARVPLWELEFFFATLDSKFLLTDVPCLLFDCPSLAAELAQARHSLQHEITNIKDGKKLWRWYTDLPTKKEKALRPARKAPIQDHQCPPPHTVHNSSQRTQSDVSAKT